MKKEARIKRYGEAAYEKMLEENCERAKRYNEEHPEEVIATRDKQNRKGGKYYERNLKNEQVGLRGEKNIIQMKHAKQYRPFKQLIAPDSQIHHEWVPDTSEYRGLALVEKEAHQYGIINVIQILDGVITLLTEEKIKKR